MEKALTFTKEQKTLIWTRFVAPVGGTKEESDHFIEVCETFGLNPLLGDVVFQRFNTKNGPSVQFITTRDGLLRVATHQPGYVGAPNANVVREGDKFQFIPSKGEVHHEFGESRGAILGAYAVMHHAKHRPVAVFVDFEEYFNANSGVKNNRNGYPNMWDKMPSAMIVKVAEVFVLRRQFPLGGLYTREEMAIDEDVEQPGQGKQHGRSNSKAEKTPTVVDMPTKKSNEQPTEQSPQKLSENQITEAEKLVYEIADLAKSEPENIIKALGKPLEDHTQNEFSQLMTSLNSWLNKAKEKAKNNKTEKVPPQQGETKQDEGEPIRAGRLTLKSKREGRTPNGTPFAEVFVHESEERLMVKDESLEVVKQLSEGDSFMGEIIEQNGFKFIETVAV